MTYEWNTSLYFGVKVVHVLAMTLWLGGPFVAVFGVRRAFNAGPDLAKATAERLLSITPVFIVSALVTILSGAVLILLAGGISRVPARILIGAALVVPIFAVGGAMNRPALMKLRDHFAAGRDVSTAEPFVQRFLWAHRIEQVLRVTILVLMVLPL
jgi:uncharacterized membrane protein